MKQKEKIDSGWNNNKLQKKNKKNKIKYITHIVSDQCEVGF